VAQQRDRRVWRLADELLAGLFEPQHDPVVRHAGVLDLERRQQLPCHALGLGAILGQCASGVPVPRRPHRGQHFPVECRPDERMPEGEVGTVPTQHAGQDRLVDDGQQIGHPAAGHDGEIRDGEVHPQQRGRL
jgi:hypothetical protein